MTTDEESNFDTLVTSPLATSFDINFEHDKDLSSLNCDDLFPNPPKYIPDTDQLSNHALTSGLEYENFAGFSDDISKPSPGYTNSNDNDLMQLKLNVEEENSYSNSHSNDGRFIGEYNEKCVEEDNTTQNSSTSASKSYGRSSLYGENDMNEQQNDDEMSRSIDDDDNFKKSKFESFNKKQIDQISSIPVEIEKMELKKEQTNRNQNDNHPYQRVQQNHQLDTVIKSEDKQHFSRTAAGISLPVSSPSLSLSSYYSSAESVSSDTTSKKKKKRHCHTCDIHFRHTRDLLKHLRIHVTMPYVTVIRLNENDINSKTCFQQQRGESDKESTESTEQGSNNNSGSSNSNNNSSSGSLKLKLKLSGSQNFEVVPINRKSPSPIPNQSQSPNLNPVEEKSKKAGAIRILKAEEIKLSPPTTPSVLPIDAMTAMTQMPVVKPSTSNNSIENRYFECPTFDISEQFNEEISHEATEDLLKKLLESNSQQNTQEADWSTNTNEFISIDRLAHICTVCHKSFSGGLGLYEHKKVTGHDINNSMHPPPPPKNSMSIAQQNYNSMRHSLQTQHMQMGMNQSYPSHSVPISSQIAANHPHSQHLQHPSQMLSQHHSTQHSSHLQHHQSQHQLSHHPSQHSSHAQMSALGSRQGYPSCTPQQPQRSYPILPPNYAQSPQMLARRPPPLYRVSNPQNISSGNPSFNDLNINRDLYYPPSSSAVMNGRIPSPGPYPNGQMPNMARPPVFLKARLQRAIRPKSLSPSNSPSAPIMMSQQQITRPKFLGSPYSGPQHISSQLGNPQVCNSQLRNSSQSVNGDPFNGPPIKKVKRETDDCEVVAMQPRVDGLPIIQSVQGGASLQECSVSEKSKDGLQFNDQVTLSMKNKESNKNPKEMANILANRGITITHKPKNGVAQEENTSKNSLAQEAVQKLQLNNSVSIISKKKNETNGTGSSCNGNDDAIRTSSSSSSSSLSRHGVGDSPFISCSVPDCEEKFLTQESLNRHMQRGHRMNKMNLKAFRCKICPALFSTQEGLVDHQRRTHRLLKTSADELGIPIIDLRNEQTKQKLASLGIINYIPLSCKGANGCFGFPIVSVQGAANPNVCNVLGMGINSLLSLGPIKPIPTKKSDL